MKTVTVTMELTPKELMRLSDYLSDPHEPPAGVSEAVLPVNFVPKAEPVMTDAEAVTAEVEKIDKSKLRAVGTALAKAGKSNELKKVFEKYGASKLGEVKEEDYEACYKDLEALRDA